LGFINKKKIKCSSYYVPCQPFRQAGKTSTTIFGISPKVLFPHKPNWQQILHTQILMFLNIIKSIWENYILAMGAKDTWGKLQKTAKLVIWRVPVSGSNRLWREKISFKSIFKFYHLVCYLHLVNKVLANEFDEI